MGGKDKKTPTEVLLVNHIFIFYARLIVIYLHHTHSIMLNNPYFGADTMSLFDDFMSSLNRPPVKKKPWMGKEAQLILGTKENITQAINEAINAPDGVYGLDTETTGLDTRVFHNKTKCSLVGICLAPTPEKAYYFPIGHSSGQEHNIPWSIIGKEFGRLLDPDVPARPVFHNASFDQEVLEYTGFYNLGVKTTPEGKRKSRWDDASAWDDTYTLICLMRPRDKANRGLKGLSLEYLSLEMIELNELFDPKVKNFNFGELDASWEACVWYAAADPVCTLRLYHALKTEINNAMAVKALPRSFMNIYTLEKGVSQAVRWMHRNRVYIDRNKVIEFVREAQREWWNSIIEVYDGVKNELGRDVMPYYLRILRGDYPEIKHLKFDPNDVSLDRNSSDGFKIISTARDYAKGYSTDFNQTLKKSVAKLTQAFGLNSRDSNADDEDDSDLDPEVVEQLRRAREKEAEEEEISFPLYYDILSAQQLGLLFRELKVPGLLTTGASGQVATDKKIMDVYVEANKETIPFMAKVSKFREYAKALTQYLIPMLEDVAEEDGTLKPRFMQLEADTGRFSCKTTAKPWEKKDGGCRVPFQGIPSTGDTKKPRVMYRMRECIASRDKDFFLAAIDYSGVELRIVTNLSGEPKWIAEFFHCSGCDKRFPKEMGDDGIIKAPPSICECGSDKIGDLHTLTAVAFYGEEAKQRKDWKALRGNAKGVNFGLCYGGTGKAVQRSIPGCTEQEGEEKYRTFVQTYDGLTGWWKKQKDFGKQYGYVVTAFGRFQPTPYLMENPPLRGNEKEKWKLMQKNERWRVKSKDERKSVNSPVQGTSADITKLAMLLIYKMVREKQWEDKFKLILTIHDELVFEIHHSILKEAIDETVFRMSRNEFVKKLGWKVPLTVDVEMGHDFTVPYDRKDLIAGHFDDKYHDKAIFDQLHAIFQETEEEKAKKEEAPKIIIEEAHVVEAPKVQKRIFILKSLHPDEANKLALTLKTLQSQPFEVIYKGQDVTHLFT
jgi:DNA polymerase I-like protein with 3'-5' exonuclease and polymerase domains